MNYKNDLNENQYNAVTTEAQHVRIIAGAGSGKTRVLTYRISYLISELGVEPWKILAITFTNKVANEMKNRVLKMIPEVSKDLTIRTFHSFAAFFLRHEISVLGFPASFSILDEEDQTKIVKDIAAEMGFKRGDKIVNSTLGYIGKQKLLEKYPDDIKIVKPAFEDEKTCLEIYTRYEEEKYKERIESMHRSIERSQRQAAKKLESIERESKKTRKAAQFAAIANGITAYNTRKARKSVDNFIDRFV